MKQNLKVKMTLNMKRMKYILKAILSIIDLKRIMSEHLEV